TRQYATEPVSPPASRLDRIVARLPRFLRQYTSPLRNAPVSHITTFLVLHELTAIVPLFGLAAAFHYGNWLPRSVSEGEWAAEGSKRFDRWLRKRGWISDDSPSAEGLSGEQGAAGARVVIELATAYAITKALLPVRLVLSVWATPWFARWTVLPVTGLVARIF
ncbi:hypothetical protein BAUCODRAFT_48959, partial [Baudoinia panamericana UAMH 10762]